MMLNGEALRGRIDRARDRVPSLGLPRLPLLAGAALTLSNIPARAQFLPGLGDAAGRLQMHQAAGASIIFGIVIFAATTAMFYLRERSRWHVREVGLVRDLTAARMRADLADLLIRSEKQAIAIWSGRDARPLIEGDLGADIGASVLAFGTWLPPAAASKLDTAVDQLKSRGETFAMTVTTMDGRHIEAEGKAVGGHAVLRLRDLTGSRKEAAVLRDQQSMSQREAQALTGLLDAIAHPAWLRDSAGRLTWINKAYLRAVDAPDAESVLARGTDILERSDREAAARARAGGDTFMTRVPAVLAGHRKVIDVLETPVTGGFAGLAVDVSEAAETRADLERLTTAHARTLDRLNTAVAIFDGSQRLVFHNSAYRQLWSFDERLLDSQPTDGELLDRLRSDRRLPEQADYRSWKSGILSAYHGVDPREDWWHLPDGRTLRVVIAPNPKGGVTYLYDDVTERMHLESQFNALARVQSETLDTLQDCVAVFGTDGRLKLINKAFVQQWRLSHDVLRHRGTGERAHVDEIATACAPLLLEDDPAWDNIRRAVVGLHDNRHPLHFRVARRDGIVVDGAVAPLPDGATLVTFTDVTASVNVERALTERNEALERAGQLREDFVHHVSYELRSPLTTIIGFAQLLGDETLGQLTPKQAEYAGHITQSSAALLAIINDILDLATIDNGALELSLSSVDIQETIEAAARGIADRFQEAALQLVVDAPRDIGAFTADGKRVRQVLYNLLSNAVGFSSPGQTVQVVARRASGEVVFQVIDQGRGIPDDIRAKVFDRFESHTSGSRHRGAGLGLSIVRSLVELHGGRVILESSVGKGTTVTCIFPDKDTPLRVAAE